MFNSMLDMCFTCGLSSCEHINGVKSNDDTESATSNVKRGPDIFRDGEPMKFGDIIGHQSAIERLSAAVTSSQRLGHKLPHIMITSPIPGIGKTALAKVTAGEYGGGVVELSGKINAKEARKALSSIEYGDVLIIDEIHLMFSGSRAGEWILQLMEEGRIVDGSGTHEYPGVTVIGATTDLALLPDAVVSRFTIQIHLTALELEDSKKVAKVMSSRYGFTEDELGELDGATCERIVNACKRNPRNIRQLLQTLRDASAVKLEVSLDTALEWSGLTPDGLNKAEQGYLMALHGMGGSCGKATLASALGEPGDIRHLEQWLMQLSYVQVTGSGRTLTSRGTARAMALLSS